MTEKEVKQAYQEAENDLKEKKKEEVKRIVKRTLEKIQDIEAKIEDAKSKLNELEKKRKLLRMDINDLKEGRLDRMEERQKKDKEAENNSVVKIEKVVEHYHHGYPPFNPWREPYKVTWSDNAIFCGTTISTSGNFAAVVDCSSAKNNTIGTYQIGETIIHLT